MKITETTTAAEVWQYHLREKRKVLDSLARNYAATVEDANHAKAKTDRAQYTFKAAERRIVELERKIAKLQHYREIVEAALADAG